MYYGILGTTTAHHDDGTPVPLGGARLRALLAALVLRQGRPVPADVLVDEVWDAEPPQDSAAALQTLVGRLRRTVGREEIGSGPAGYWLTGGRTDVGEFQRLAEQGRRALRSGEPGRAAELLRAALVLWRGPALADLPDRAAPATRLEAQRDEALRDRITAELDLGQAADLTPELAELGQDRPLDEPVQELLIRALGESGRTAEALRQYETVRRALAEQLGTDPGPALQSLHRKLLTPAEPLPLHPAGDPHAAGSRSAAGNPRPSGSPSAAGNPSSAGTPTPVVNHRAAGNLRPRLTSFVGRDADLAALAQALTASRLTTLTGPGGSGKTRLSVEAGRAEQAAGGWPDGVWLVELAPLEDSSAVPAAVAAALGLRETVLHTGGAITEGLPALDRVQKLVEHLGPRRLLLVLDNCEHLIQAAAELADRLLAECPQLTVLATSREPLGVPGEAVLPVEPLPGPVAMRLLAERGAAARPGFDPAEDPAACAEICRRLDGLPLAIELAAARLRAMSPRAIADRLDGRFALLTAGARTVLPRQQTLRAVVDWSWELLGKRERAVLARLSVFAGGCTLADAEQVVADGTEVAREDVADLLLSLVDKSLLVADLGDEPRYGMLETIHEYAAERLAEAGETETAMRHVRHFRELVRTANQHLNGHQQLYWLGVLDRELENIRAALRRAVDAREEQEGLVLALGMSWFWQLRDLLVEARGWYEGVAALGPDPFADDAPPPVPLETNPLDAPPPMAEGLLNEARRQIRIHRLVGLFAGNMAMLGDPDAIDTAHRILRTYTPELPQSYRYPVLMRVFAAFLAGEMDSMRALVDEVVEGTRRHGREGDLAFALHLRARMVNDWVGGLEGAIRDGAEALELFERLGDRWGMSGALAAQAENASKQGDGAAAAVAYRRAIEIAEELGAFQEVPLLRVRLGEALIETEPEHGEAMVREALVALETGSQPTNGAMLYGRLVLCTIHTVAGEYREALAELDLLESSHRAFGPVVPGVFLGIIACIRGWVVARQGDAEEGLVLVREGRRRMTSVEGNASIFASHMAVMLLLPVAGVLLELARQRGELAAAHRATVLLGAQQGLYGALGSFLERRDRDRCHVELRELLGAERYRAALDEGARLTVEEAAALLNTTGDF